MTDHNDLDRRRFMTAAVGAAAGLGASALTPSTALAADAPAGSSDLAKPPAGGPGSGGQFSLLRAEVTINDCEVEGKLPHDLDGGFFATGPDPQYPRLPGNILFDGEGHVRVFRIKNGRVDYRTRYARGVRYLEHGHLALVFESSRERRLLLTLAPHLVRPLAFTWPVYRGARVPLWKVRAPR